MNSAPTILITGASGGVGQAAANDCAQHGARIAVHYNRNKDAAEQLLAALPGNGHQLFQADITDPGAVEATFEILYMTGWRPHSSQQTAKQRGTATVSLSDLQKHLDGDA